MENIRATAAIAAPRDGIAEALDQGAFPLNLKNDNFGVVPDTIVHFSGRLFI